MKVRMDYVSNSSSSSFLLVGSEYVPNDGYTLTIDDFDNLKDGEEFFLVDPNVCDGDYVMRLTPEMMLDFDMRERPIVVDTYVRGQIFKVRKFCREDWEPDLVYDARNWGKPGTGVEGDIHKVELMKGEELVELVVDDHSPTHPRDVLDWIAHMYGRRD